jgi:HK97 family phage major capsid protein
MTLTELKAQLAVLSKANPDRPTYMAKAKALVNGSDIIGEDGQPIEVDLIELSTDTANDNPEPPDEVEAAKAKAKADEDLNLRVAKAVKDTLTDINKIVTRKVSIVMGDEPVDRMDEGGVPMHVKCVGGLRTKRLLAAKSANGETLHKTYDYKATAYRFGTWAAACMGHDWALKRCKQLGVLVVKGHTEGSNSAGGYLVPEEFGDMMIDLREAYGVFRQRARILPMASDVRTDRRRKGGLTAYFVDEASAITGSTKAWDQVSLTAKKLAAVALVSNELNEDGIINFGDDLISEMAYAFALKEDQCGFIGDGTSTYAGIVGVQTKINDGNHDASIYTAASGNTSFGTLDLVDFNGVQGLLPEFAETPNTAWYVSKKGWANSMQRLKYAAGGNTLGDVGGPSGREFLGYPVVVSQVLFSTLTASVSTIHCLFGDLSLAARLGDRSTMEVTFSDQGTIDGVNLYETDQIAVRGKERFDINVHDLGDDTDAGPIVALKTPAS